MFPLFLHILLTVQSPQAAPPVTVTVLRSASSPQQSLLLCIDVSSKPALPFYLSACVHVMLRRPHVLEDMELNHLI